MNKVILSGRLTRDVDLRQTPAGKSVCSFALAVDRKTKDKEADFPTIIAWGGLAEFVTRYLSKGRKIVVEGQLRTRQYKDKDEKTVFVTEIVAESIEFADSKTGETSVYDDSTTYESNFGEQ